MKAEFNKQFNQLENKRLQLFDSLKEHSDEIINRKPAPTAWSVAEALQHLMVADKGTLMYLQKKTQDLSRSKKTGFKEFIKYNVLKLAFNLPLKFKAPTVTAPKNENASLMSIDIEWAQIKKDTLDLLNKLDDKDFTKDLWKHPISGKMNLFQMVAFNSIHFDRHQSQVERTIVALT